jgi:2-keto-3-deoxy-L-rhamnonate aldolase RhmA
MESGRRVESAEAIAAVRGVEALFVGPTDLKLSLQAGDRRDRRVGNFPENPASHFTRDPVIVC